MAGGGGRGRASAYDEAVRLLAVRALSTAEVRTRLARRGHAPGEIESAVRALIERRYLDDRALAYNVGSFLAARRKHGRVRVAVELARRALPRETVHEAIERVFGDIDEEALVLEAARAGARALGRSKREARDVRARLSRSLLRRGFSHGLVLGAVARVMAGMDAGDEVSPRTGTEGIASPAGDEDVPAVGDTVSGTRGRAGRVRERTTRSRTSDEETDVQGSEDDDDF